MSMIRRAAVLILISAALAGPAGAQVASTSPMAAPAATTDSIKAAARQAEASGCRTPSCRSVAILAAWGELDEKGMRTTMGLARPIPRDRDKRVATGRRRLILDHRARYAAVCDEAVAILRTADRPGSEPGVGESFVALASQMDASRPEGCLDRVMVALPRAAAWDDAVEAARIHCIYGVPPGGARCAKIRRGDQLPAGGTPRLR